MTTKATRFDLTELNAKSSRDWAGYRLLAWTFVALGVFMFGSGIYLAISLRLTWASGSLGEGVLLAVFGLIIVAVARAQAIGTSRLPSTLAITDSELTLEWAGSGKKVVVPWEGPDLSLTILDRRGMPHNRPDGTERPTFTLVVPSGKRVSIPNAAYESMTREIAAHGLLETRKTIRASTDSGSFDRVVISPREKHQA
jgi:hypothetical protein